MTPFISAMSSAAHALSAVKAFDRVTRWVEVGVTSVHFVVNDESLGRQAAVDVAGSALEHLCWCIGWTLSWGGRARAR